MPRHRSTLALAILTSCFGCTDKAAPPSASVDLAELRRAESCPDVERMIKDRALDHMHQRFDEAARELRQSDNACFRTRFFPRNAYESELDVADAGAVPEESEPSEQTADAVSTTNNQVSGVDEADFIKNDDKYMYAALNGAFRIIEAWPADKAHEIANVKLEGTPKKLFVRGDRALVYVSQPRAAGDKYLQQHRAECTYAYDCDFAGDGTATRMIVFDISDRTSPRELRRIDASGSLLAARRIDSAVHTVLVTPELLFPSVLYPALWRCSGDGDQNLSEALAALDKQRRDNVAVIEQATAEQLLPRVTEGEREYALNSCDSVYGETIPTGGAFTTIVSLDMSEDSAPELATVISKPGAVYASKTALYVAVNQAEPDYHSVIHKFDIGDDITRTAYVASGRVEGNVLSQFSLDEHNAHLRVATSFGKVPADSVHSALSVLAQQDGALTLTGKIDDIAPSEDIRSVRFDGDRGFIVTFKKTDPLYAFDLSDPAAPQITGELKIPGFSTYMHMLDDTHLLTIGYDAADQGDFAFFTGVLLQIFDVSDIRAPKLAHKAVIGTRGTSSEALTNHLAFTLFQNKLSVPMTICEGGSDQGGYGTDMTFSGLMVFDVSVEDGIRERRRVEHPSSNGAYDDDACSQWWTQAKSVVQRSVFMDDFVYSIASDVMRVQNLDALGSDLASVSLTQ
jgi:hypothetical protein